MLALDREGEIVLLELKVDGAFRLTDLQALAYAAGYASLPPVHFADLLRKRLDKGAGQDGVTSLDEAKLVRAARGHRARPRASSQTGPRRDGRPGVARRR